MGRMPKKKIKRQSDEALLSEVKKEMAQPRAAESTREYDVNEGDPDQQFHRPAKNESVQTTKKRNFASLLSVLYGAEKS